MATIKLKITLKIPAPAGQNYFGFPGSGSTLLVYLVEKKYFVMKF